MLGPVGFTDQVHIEGQDSCTGAPVVLTGGGNHSSPNPSVATVGSTSGLVSGVAPGQTNISNIIYYMEGPEYINGSCVLNNVSEQTDARVASVAVSCSPPTVTRGQTTTCSVTVTNAPQGTQIAYSNWKFTGGGATVNRSGSNNVPTWGGVMVTGGTVSVNVQVGTAQPQPASASITVSPRAWHTTPATASQVPNGTFISLPVPPQNTGQDSGLGASQWRATDNGAPGSTIADNGPNDGFYYYTSPLTFSVFDFRYEINPDLENSGSLFSQRQCGNYNASSNPSGFISWTNLLTQTRRHEYSGLIQSHHAFYKNAVNANNPGDYVESRVGNPGINIPQFDQDTKDGRDARYALIGSATAVEPFGVNLSETGTFLGNINYQPYVPCN